MFDVEKSRFFGSPMFGTGHPLSRRQQGLFKIGGNVVSYFCTPDGRVLNFVIGPVRPQRLLSEAKWSLAAYRHLQQLDAQEPAAQAKAMRKLQRARCEKTDAKLLVAVRAVRRANLRQKATDPKLAEVGRDLISKLKHHPSPSRIVLADRPLPQLSEIRRFVFEDIAGEQIVENPEMAKEVAQWLKQHREQGMPTLLMVANDDGRHHVAAARASVARVLGSEQLAVPLRRFGAAWLWRDQWMLLTRDVELEPLRSVGFSRLQIVVLDRDGRQVASLIERDGPAKLVGAMQRALLVNDLDRADQLASQAKIEQAEKLFNTIATQARRSDVRQRAMLGYHEMRVRRAVELSHDGQNISAERLLRRTIRATADTPLATHARTLLVEMKRRP